LRPWATEVEGFALGNLVERAGQDLLPDVGENIPEDGEESSLFGDGIQKVEIPEISAAPGWTDGFGRNDLACLRVALADADTAVPCLSLGLIPVSFGAVDIGGFSDLLVDYESHGSLLNIVIIITILREKVKSHKKRKKAKSFKKTGKNAILNQENKSLC
jgi:hypothetical protein